MSNHGLLLAAGAGTRMGRPKALVEVGGKALVDHVLDRLAEAGVTRAVVNVHWFADRLEAHLAERGRGPEIVISDERAELLSLVDRLPPDAVPQPVDFTGTVEARLARDPALAQAWRLLKEGRPPRAAP